MFVIVQFRKNFLSNVKDRENFWLNLTMLINPGDTQDNKKGI